jgi:hypothetical protein
MRQPAPGTPFVRCAGRGVDAARARRCRRAGPLDAGRRGAAHGGGASGRERAGLVGRRGALRPRPPGEARLPHVLPARATTWQRTLHYTCYTLYYTLHHTFYIMHYMATYAAKPLDRSAGLAAGVLSGKCSLCERLTYPGRGRPARGRFIGRWIRVWPILCAGGRAGGRRGGPGGRPRRLCAAPGHPRGHSGGPATSHAHGWLGCVAVAAWGQAWLDACEQGPRTSGRLPRAREGRVLGALAAPAPLRWWTAPCSCCWSSARCAGSWACALSRPLPADRAAKPSSRRTCRWRAERSCTYLPGRSTPCRAPGPPRRAALRRGRAQGHGGGVQCGATAVRGPH